MKKNGDCKMNKQVLLELKDLSKTYGDKPKQLVKAVDGVDLIINKGEIFGLVGESGCGKSTLGQMIVQLVSPTKGELLYDGVDIAKLTSKQKKAYYKNIQIIFQDPYSSINPKKTIGWLIEEPLIIHNLYSDAKERGLIIDTMLKLVGLDESYKTRYPAELSGGQRQRVAIAIALILEPNFVVCDEAVSALDVSVQAQVLNLLKDLQQRMMLTYLFISHNLGVVSYIADRIAVMYLGRIVEVAKTEDIINKPLHPYTIALFSASTDLNEAGDRVVLTGEIPSPLNPPSGCAFHTRCQYAKDICKTEKPERRVLSNGREVACHIVEEVL